MVNLRSGSDTADPHTVRSTPGTPSEQAEPSRSSPVPQLLTAPTNLSPQVVADLCAAQEAAREASLRVASIVADDEQEDGYFSAEDATNPLAMFRSLQQQIADMQREQSRREQQFRDQLANERRRNDSLLAERRARPEQPDERAHEYRLLRKVVERLNQPKSVAPFSADTVAAKWVKLLPTYKFHTQFASFTAGILSLCQTRTRSNVPHSDVYQTLATLLFASAEEQSKFEDSEPRLYSNAEALLSAIILQKATSQAAFDTIRSHTAGFAQWNALTRRFGRSTPTHAEIFKSSIEQFKPNSQETLEACFQRLRTWSLIWNEPILICLFAIKCDIFAAAYFYSPILP